MCQFEVPTRCSDSDMFNAYERFLWEHCPLTSLVVLCSLYSSLLPHQPKKPSFLSGFASPRSGWFRTRVSESLFWSTWVCRLLAQCVLSSPSAALSLRLSVETLLLISLWIPQPTCATWPPLHSPEELDENPLHLHLPIFRERSIHFLFPF